MVVDTSQAPWGWHVTLLMAPHSFSRLPPLFLDSSLAADLRDLRPEAQRGTRQWFGTLSAEKVGRTRRLFYLIRAIMR